MSFGLSMEQSASHSGSPCTPTPAVSPSTVLGQQETEASEEDLLSEYQEELQTVLEYVDQGMILKSLNLLRDLTEKVVTNLESIGLTTESTPAARREGFWRGLNNCWLFALSHAQDWSRPWDGPTLRAPLQDHHLVRLQTHVVQWADRLEPWGLVNYELGLWERDILEAIESCLTPASLASSPLPSTAPASPPEHAAPESSSSTVGTTSINTAHKGV